MENMKKAPTSKLVRDATQVVVLRLALKMEGLIRKNKLNEVIKRFLRHINFF